MTTPIPTTRDAKSAFRALSKEDQDWVWYAVETGVPVRDPEHAAVAVAYARHRLRTGLTRELPFYAGSALAGGFIAYLVSDGSSAAFAFTFVLGLAGFVGHLWWWSTWRLRQRALAANVALVEGREPPARQASPDGRWFMLVPLAWITAMAFAGVAHAMTGRGDWVGLPVFVVALVLYRRLFRRADESIDSS